MYSDKDEIFEAMYFSGKAKQRTPTFALGQVRTRLIYNG